MQSDAPDVSKKFSSLVVKNILAVLIV